MITDDMWKALQKRNFGGSAHPHGHAIGRSKRKLLPDEVRQIRQMVVTIPKMHVAERFGISADLLRRIIKGELYRDVA